MQATLISRSPHLDSQGQSTTQDYTLDVVLPGKGRREIQAVATVPASEWSSNSVNGHAHAGVAQSADVESSSAHYRPHSLPSSFSPLGSNSPHEFATFVQGREAWLANPEFRDGVEESLRVFAEKSDETEGFLINTTVTDGFSGLTPLFLELLRDEFGGGGGKGQIWVTGMVEDERGWDRPASDRSLSHLLLSPALALPSLMDLSSLVLPVQPLYTFSPTDPRETGWTKYFRKDLDEHERLNAMGVVREMALGGVGEELRVPGSLSSLISQLTWRGSNANIAHLSGAAPMPPAEHFGDGKAGMARLKASWKDFSVLRPEEMGKERVRPRPRPATPYAQSSVLRGMSFEETQALGPLLEESAGPLREPLSRWVTADAPYPLLPSTPSVFSGLLPNGRPLTLPTPTLTDPHTSGGLFGLPDPSFPPASSYTVQPNSIPILTTVSTTPDVRYWIRHLRDGLKEMKRVRNSVVREVEGGEFGVGFGGVEEVREGLEGVVDAFGGEDDEDNGDGQGGKDEDEDWSATEPKEEFDDFEFDT
ncbi:hypothetical protein JCM11641_005681 [Rhodosporidiobolus odoratus]